MSKVSNSSFYLIMFHCLPCPRFFGGKFKKMQQALHLKGHIGSFKKLPDRCLINKFDK
jgi:hypothetical protein